MPVSWQRPVLSHLQLEKTKEHKSPDPPCENRFKACALGVLRQMCTSATTGDPFKAWATTQSSGGFCRCPDRAAVPAQHHRLLFFPLCTKFTPFSNSTANLLPLLCASQQSCFVSFALNKTKKMVNKNFCRYVLFLFLRPSEANSSALMGSLLICLTLLVALALSASAV